MLHAEALERLHRAPVGRFATITPSGAPHIVPVTFALVDDAIVHMIDHKPKTTRRLQREINIEANPAAGLLIDEYDDDWDNLWWVRVDGMAHVATSGSEWRDARSALINKYVQYRERPPTGQAIYLEIDDISAWESTP